MRVLKEWCEIRKGRTPGPSDVAEERMRPCCAQWGHDLSMGRTLEKLGPSLYIHPSAWKVNSAKLISLGSPLRPQRLLPGLLMDTPPYVPDEFLGVAKRK